MKPFPLILSAPSGGGKTTIAKELLRRRRDVGYSVSCTTRRPRAGETDGRDYHFLSQLEFEARRDRGEFAEWAEVHGRLYGTLQREVERVLSGGKHCIMDIDVQGAKQFTRVFPDSVLVFVLPPSAEALLARLTARKTEDRRMLALRLQGAREELRAVGMYHYVVVNDALERAVAQVSSIVDAESVRHARIEKLDDQIAALIEGLERTIGDYSNTAT